MDASEIEKLKYDPYYDSVAKFLSRMGDGETFSIREKVKEEDQQKFKDCFVWYASVNRGAYWWDWDGETDIITKHAEDWLKEMERKS